LMGQEVTVRASQSLTGILFVCCLVFCACCVYR
jgi:hypothetical protein